MKADILEEVIQLSSMISKLKERAEQRNQSFIEGEWLDGFAGSEKVCFERKLKSLESRGKEIVKSSVKGQILGQRKWDKETAIEYALHFQHLIRKGSSFTLEEYKEQRRATFEREELIKDVEVVPKTETLDKTITLKREQEPLNNERWVYDRREAVRYAERWWNDRNPAYKNFNDNCTNYISQCLRAGGAPMTGYPDRSKGWWYQNNNWSFSWSVAHSFRWYLSGAKSGLRGVEVSEASLLQPGDVICYDFNGDGRWQHTTIVVAKDEDGMPLVNANTANSRMRYWAYEDSTAWTPNIKYKFFQIADSTT